MMWLEAAGLVDEQDTKETIRHELAHLLGAQWGQCRVQFNSEGLATWAQRTEKGRVIDFVSLVSLLTDSALSLDSWVNGRTDVDKAYGTFMVAGSFTGYLLRRFGRDCYRHWYGMAHAKNFESSFEHCFGVALATVEQDWRGWLLARREEFEPSLTRAVHETRIKLALKAGTKDPPIVEGQALIDAGSKDSVLHLYLARAYESRGQYSRALQVVLELIRQQGVVAVESRSAQFFYAGWLWERLGSRHEAISCYLQALQHPDFRPGKNKSMHWVARRALDRLSPEHTHKRVCRHIWKRVFAIVRRSVC